MKMKKPALISSSVRLKSLYDGLSPMPIKRARLALHKKSGKRTSLCNLCVLCVSVVCFCLEFINHRDTENTEVAQRKLRRTTFCTNRSCQYRLRNPPDAIALPKC